MIEYTCKHCAPYSGQCYVKSGRYIEPIGIVHYQIGCGGKCEKYEKEEEK